jgi:steroid delta-isomerase-like uncharacterized protein
MVDQAHATVIARHVTAEHARRMEDTLATLAEDCMFEDRTLGLTLRGREGARRYYTMWWDAFANGVHVDDHRWTEDGGVVAEVRFQGVHSGPFLGIAPTGRQIDLPIVILVTGFRSGLMAGERIYWDVGTLLRQLDVSTIPDIETWSRAGV